MNEAEWLANTEATRLDTFLVRQRSRVGTWRGRISGWLRRSLIVASDRQLRLFVCACCRRRWPLIVEEIDRRAIEVAERHADGEASEQELCAVTEAVLHRKPSYPGETPHPPLAYGAANACRWPTLWDGDPLDIRFPKVVGAIGMVVNKVAHAAARPIHVEGRAAWQAAADAENREQTALLRDILGNPFRPVTVSVDWRTDIVVTLANQMYDSQDFSAMPILADALQDAGCDTDAILDHCRDANIRHARGCWVVDLVLGKR
jgi:hypothetical protein